MNAALSVVAFAVVGGLAFALVIAIAAALGVDGVSLTQMPQSDFGTVGAVLTGVVALAVGFFAGMWGRALALKHFAQP